MDLKKIIGIIILLVLLCVIIYVIYKIVEDYRDVRAGEPWLVKDTKIARTPKIIPGYLIEPSTDSRYGIEFSYVFWIYVTDWTYKKNELKHVFHKGNNSMRPMMQSPGVWLSPDTNKMYVVMNTFNNVDEKTEIDNLPIAKWFHVAIILINKNLDIYINGKLKKRVEFSSVPKQNHGDLYVNLDNGFDGFLSKFRYFNYALPFWRLEKIFNEGPSDQKCEGSDLPVPPYLASDYWFQKN